MTIFDDKNTKNTIGFIDKFNIKYIIFDWNGKLDYAIKDNIYYVDPKYLEILLTQGF